MIVCFFVDPPVAPLDPVLSPVMLSSASLSCIYPKECISIISYIIVITKGNVTNTLSTTTNATTFEESRLTRKVDYYFTVVGTDICNVTGDASASSELVMLNSECKKVSNKFEMSVEIQ